MAAAAGPKPPRVKVREGHARLREQGASPDPDRVPDVHSPTFRAAAHSQSLAVADSAHADDDKAFIDAVSDWDEN